MAGPKSWHGARTTASTTSSDCPATRFSTGSSTRPPTTSAPAARSRKAVLRGFAETRYQAKSWKTDAPRLRPHRGDRPGPRHPLRRHQSRHRLGRAPLRRPLLRPRPGREPDQDAQEPARLRPHQLPLADRQPGPPRPAHRRLLADARPARRRPEAHPSPKPSSPRCGSGSSSSAPASSKPSRASAWPSPPPVPRPPLPPPRHRACRTLSDRGRNRPAKTPPANPQRRNQCNPNQAGQNPQPHARPISRAAQKTIPPRQRHE